MEWFWRLVDQLQKGAAFSTIQSFKPFDWVFVIAVLWGLGQGSRKGFSDMFGKLLGVFLVSMLTLSFYREGARFLGSNLSVLSPEVAEALAFFFLGIFLWMTVSWCINLFGKFIKIEAQGLLKTLGGMVLGVLWMALLLSFIVQFLLFLPIEPLQQVFRPGHTYSGYTISRLVPDLHKVVVSPLRKTNPKKLVEVSKTGV